MKKKKIFLLLTVTAMIFAAVAGCGKKETEKKKETKVEKVEKLKTIGTKDDDAYVIKLTNATGQDITAFSVKSSGDAAYPENMLKDSDKFTVEEEREVYYTPSDAAKTTATADGKEIPVEYLVQITVADGKVYELHAFPFEDMKEGELKLEEGIAYLTYSSVSTKEEVSTLDAEKAVKAQAEAAAKAKAEAEAAAKAQAEAAAKAQAEAEAAAAAAAQEAANQQYYYEENNYTDNNYTDNSYNSAGSDDGCVGDGLTY